MKISKILNNNSAVVIDENNQEVVIVGKGVAYNKKTGDPVNPAKIQKTFCLSSQQLNTKFQEILVSLPMEEVAVVGKIVNNIKMSLGRPVSDSIYVSLSDHIHYALKNYEKGIQVHNSLLFDIMKFYPDEYQLGKKGIEIIQGETGVALADDEAGFIALHIVNAETENAIGTDKIEQSTKIIEQILDIVRAYFNTEINEGSLTYYRFINHLRYFSQRIVSHSTFKNDKSDENLLQMMKTTYSDSYLCAINIKGFVKGRFDVDIGSEELLYLVIHIQRAIFNK
ncbi:MAG: PRD domain-containing protein [Solobacterium sp.]|nr:PRD domain-containing protein [Solobacterium sp.]MCH4205954.1 PRD domain-containing protein [Solobacterium sp.]MCH4226213.1 PRD domain-containing protein [Solobacterium sp.]MCH4282742.1 PRD domain-containing protein [Solobacterium sp.]